MDISCLTFEALLHVKPQQLCSVIYQFSPSTCIIDVQLVIGSVFSPNNRIGINVIVLGLGHNRTYTDAGMDSQWIRETKFCLGERIPLEGKIPFRPYNRLPGKPSSDVQAVLEILVLKKDIAARTEVKRRHDSTCKGMVVQQIRHLRIQADAKATQWINHKGSGQAACDKLGNVLAWAGYSFHHTLLSESIK